MLSSTARSVFVARSGVRSDDMAYDSAASARGRRSIHGFSLVELLLVAAIMVMLIAISGRVLQNLGRSQELITSGQILGDLMQLARQAAITHNRTVQFRFYQTTDATAPAGQYTAVQAFLDDPPTPIGRINRLPNQIIVKQGSDISSLLLTGAGQISGQDNNGTYVAFRFRPDGSLDLTPTSNYTATVVRATDPIGNQGLPANFLTLQLDPVTGRFTTFHP